MVTPILSDEAHVDEETRKGVVTARFRRLWRELLSGYVGDISPLVKAKAVASALPAEPVLP